MAVSQKKLNDALREEYLDKIIEMLGDWEDEILRVGTNEIAIPCVDAEKNEKFIQVVVKVPTGSRDGEPYDGYALAEDYQMKLKIKEEKRKEKELAKEKKKARDEKMRQRKEELKAKRDEQFPLFPLYGSARAAENFGKKFYKRG